ncbi:MAG: hypothetical protein IH899_17530 [Planctomycetes bacterium]|nr:hypothetical protein [Planctomycetota bacterium]
MATNKTKQQNRRPQSLLSQSAILILSGYLVGVSAGLTANPALQFSIHAAGMIGLIAFFGLGHLSRIKREREADALEQTIDRLELRIDRHVHPYRPRHKVARSRTDHDMYNQYVPVTHANRPSRRTVRRTPGTIPSR